MRTTETPAKMPADPTEQLQELGVFPSALMREDLADFAGYSSARTSDSGAPATIWLNANEASSPSAADPDGTHRRYPDPQPAELVAALAQAYAVAPEQVVVGRGSDEGIDLLVRALCPPGQSAGIVQAPPTFGMYAVSARLHGVPVIEVPQIDRGASWQVDVEAVGDAARSGGARVVFLASPGNPTGGVVPLEDIEQLATALAQEAVLVIDEAYQEFAAPASAATLLGAHPNLVVLRTLSKAHGLAGARVGTVLCHPDLARVLRRVQAPYPVPASVTELGVAALSGAVRRSVEARVRQTRASREHLAEVLSADPRVDTVYASEANFLLVRTRAADAVLDDLRGNGIVVRDMRHLLTDAVRVTVGSPAEIDAVRAALQAPPDAAPPVTSPTPTPARGIHS